MNSKQRRKDARKWQWHVHLDFEHADRNGYDNMFDWCRDTFGNGKKCAGWRECHNYIGTWWQFTSKEKATLFMLRWS
jgi:hypothetical protein